MSWQSARKPTSILEIFQLVFGIAHMVTLQTPLAGGAIVTASRLLLATWKNMGITANQQKIGL